MKQVTSAALFILLLMPTRSAEALDVRSLPEDFQAAKVAVTAAATDAFCARFPATKTRIEALLEEKNERVKDYLGGLVENLGDRRANRDAFREGLRSEIDQKRSVWLEELRGRAETDDEKKAIKQYQKQIEEAIDDRREAIDEAIVAYRTSVDVAVTKRRAAMESTRSAFQSSVRDTLGDVQRNCEEGNGGAAIARNFKAALAAARTKLEADKKNALLVEGQVKDLLRTRKQAAETAFVDYQATLAAARSDLEAAFSGSN